MLCRKEFSNLSKCTVRSDADAVRKLKALLGCQLRGGVAAVVNPFYRSTVGPLLNKVRHQVGSTVGYYRPRFDSLVGVVGVIYFANFLCKLVGCKVSSVLCTEAQLEGVPVLQRLALLRLLLEILRLLVWRVVDKNAIACKNVYAVAMNVPLRTRQSLALFLKAHVHAYAVDQRGAAV